MTSAHARERAVSDDRPEGHVVAVFDDRVETMRFPGMNGIGHRRDLLHLTCWIALDDVSEANGTVSLLPYARAGTRDVVAHVRDEQTNDMIGYFGDDAGDPVVVPAGSIACFSSTVVHRSGPNATEHVRRVYVAQYSTEPLLNEERSRPRHLAEPLLIDGLRP